VLSIHSYAFVNILGEILSHLPLLPYSSCLPYSSTFWGPSSQVISICLNDLLNSFGEISPIVILPKSIAFATLVNFLGPIWQMISMIYLNNFVNSFSGFSTDFHFAIFFTNLQEAFKTAAPINEELKKNGIRWCILQKFPTSDQEIFFIISRKKI